MRKPVDFLSHYSKRNQEESSHHLLRCERPEANKTNFSMRQPFHIAFFVRLLPWPSRYLGGTVLKSTMMRLRTRPFAASAIVGKPQQPGQSSGPAGPEGLRSGLRFTVALAQTSTRSLIWVLTFHPHGM